MTDKVYENMYNKYTDFGMWTEEIIREGLREAYKLGYYDADVQSTRNYRAEHEENNL